MITDDLKLKNCNWERNQHDSKDNNEIYYLFTSKYSLITVLDRVTGFGDGIRDIETGWRDEDGKFWLASGNFDIREFPELTVQEAINKIKDNANICVPKEG